MKITQHKLPAKPFPRKLHFREDFGTIVFTYKIVGRNIYIHTPDCKQTIQVDSYQLNKTTQDEWDDWEDYDMDHPDPPITPSLIKDFLIREKIYESSGPNQVNSASRKTKK